MMLSFPKARFCDWLHQLCSDFELSVISDVWKVPLICLQLVTREGMHASGNYCKPYNFVVSFALILQRHGCCSGKGASSCQQCGLCILNQTRPKIAA